MKSPGFWQTRNAPLALLLAPLGWVYAEVTAWRLAHGHPWKAPVRVICVGNLTAGGAGKTPIVRDLALRLKVRGYRPGILSRGYGGTAQGPLKVDPARHDAVLVGDEPLLLAQGAPCWVASDRAEGARAMVADGIDLILMDDGLQNPGLHQDLRIIVADGTTGFGNGRPIPAGPLREQIGAGIGRADALIITGEDHHNLGRAFSSQLKILQTTVAIRNSLPSGTLVAFAGIGRPEKFRATLVSAGADIAEFQAFADHHVYTDGELSALSAKAQRLGAQLVTTEKDWVRLNVEWRNKIKAIEIDLVWRDEEEIESLLDGIMGNG
jgi:tetraacyldisaccharide 4'-kinase